MSPPTSGKIRRVASGVALLALALGAILDQPPNQAIARSSMGPAQRLLGPIASAAASVEWARYWAALDRGDEPRAYGHAARALSLDARSTAGWLTLADHFVFLRASPLEEDEPAARRRWIRAGLEILRTGEDRVAAPGDLAHYAAQVRAVFLAKIPDEHLRWPGGPAGLLKEARADLERAAGFGHPGVVIVLEYIEARELEIAASDR